MTLKLESTANEIWRCWNLALYHHFTHIACAKKLRGLRQKLDALRVQTSPSPSKYKSFRRKLICYIGISFFLNLFELQTFCVFNMHHQKPHPKISTLSNFILLFFMHLMIYFELNDHKIGNHLKWTLNLLNLAMVSSFHPHSMC